jgi:protein Jumonji
MFSLEQLLFAIANDQRSKDKTIRKILPMLESVYESEKVNRDKLKVNNRNFHRKLQIFNEYLTYFVENGSS